MPAVIQEDRFLLRGGLKAALVALNEIPLRREMVVELDGLFTTGKFDAKIGDGTTHYVDLPYLQTGGGAPSGGVVRPTGNAYTATAGDNGNTIISSDATGFALTIPTDATAPMPIGAKIAYTQGAAGPITVTGASGVAVHAANGNTTGRLWDGGVAEKIGPNEWQLWNGPALATVATSGSYNDLKDLPASGGGGGDVTAINEQTGTTYALVLADATKAVRMTNAAACSLTIPANATVALPLYRAIPAFQGGAGKVTLVAASGVTLEAPNGAVTNGAGDFRTAFQRAIDVWVIG